MNQCEIKGNVALKSHFEQEFLKMEDELIQLKLSKPALRALVRMNIYNLSDLKQIDLNALKHAHGIGPAAIIKLQPFL